MLCICRLAHRNGGNFLMLSNGQGRMGNNEGTNADGKFGASILQTLRNIIYLDGLHEKVWP